MNDTVAILTLVAAISAGTPLVFATVGEVIDRLLVADGMVFARYLRQRQPHEPA